MTIAEEKVFSLLEIVNKALAAIIGAAFMFGLYHAGRITEHDLKKLNPEERKIVYQLMEQKEITSLRVENLVSIVEDIKDRMDKVRKAILARNYFYARNEIINLKQELKALDKIMDVRRELKQLNQLRLTLQEVIQEGL